MVKKLFLELIFIAWDRIYSSSLYLNLNFKNYYSYIRQRLLFYLNLFFKIQPIYMMSLNSIHIKKRWWGHFFIKKRWWGCKPKTALYIYLKRVELWHYQIFCLWMFIFTWNNAYECQYMHVYMRMYAYRQRIYVCMRIWVWAYQFVCVGVGSV